MLGGGGMFGAYQAGAWQELAPRFSFDLICGASIGALNGWAFASLCPPHEWIAQWLDLTPAALPRFRFPRSPLGGIVQSEVFEAFVQSIHARFTPRIPFTVALTDLLRLSPYAVSTPNVSWIHLAASCAVPGVFPQYRINGRLTSDGGLLDALPIWAAVQAGATRIVAINVLPRGGSPWLRAPRALLHLAGHRPAPPPPSVKILRIQQPAPLGPLRDMLRWSPQSAQRLVALGRRDAQAALHNAASLFETF